MSPRASLPGAEELFRRTERPGEKVDPPKESPQVDKAPKLQVATPAGETETAAPTETKKAPRHEEKVTFYCTSDDLMNLERARLALRAEHGIAADRGRIVRASLAYILEDFEARGEDSLLLRKLDE
ncbi:MAG TPA: hypothetical protein VE889_05035 [Actinomycetota bacterium]|nr:hypothetical protein [Actinomycetota bacterium]